MTALLTDNLPLLAGAPNGIKKLRELILELAVRGKLVPQDSNDEPASELLKSIAEGKAQLIAGGKKQKPQAAISEEEKPFSLPLNWAWVRLGSTLEMINGRAFKPTEWIAAGLPIVRIQNLNKPDAPFNYCNPDTVDDRHVIDTGTILISWSGTPGTSFGAFIWERGKAALNQHIFSCFQIGDAFFDKFLKLAINTRLDELIAKAHGGVGLQHVTKGKLEALTLVLPPLAEQHRIVAKVDELMALCDRLEARQADAESAHTQLVQALLDSLTQASVLTARDGGNARNAGAISGQDFAASWQRLAEHFHTLFTTDPSIDALKQALLQLAVMGKLVPQDPTDEPANELLKRIAEKKSQLAAEGEIKKQKPLIDIAQGDAPFEKPCGWSWVRLEALTKVITKGSSPKWQGISYTDNPNDVLFVTSENVGSYKLRLESKKYVEREFNTIEPRSILHKGDFLMNIVGASIGRTAIFDIDMEANINQAVCLIRSFSEFLNNQFLLHFFNSEICLSYMFDRQVDNARANLSMGSIANFVLPIPPLAEQHRIVAKLDQLMALCGQLKTRLTQARQLNEQLASTLVKRALAEDRQQAPVTTDRQVARTLLAAEITHQLHGQRTFGQRKLQKVIYLAEHAARLATIQGDYLRDAAGPHDRQLMNQVEGELQKRQWYERIERETVGHAYRPLSDAGQHRQVYESTWSAAERATIERVIELMRDWDTDRCEKTVTLYAAWNDFILEGRPVTDEAIVAEVMHRWNDTKLRFSKAEWLAVLAEMKKYEVLTPTGFDNRTTGGMLTLPGFE